MPQLLWLCAWTNRLTWRREFRGSKKKNKPPDAPKSGWKKVLCARVLRMFFFHQYSRFVRKKNVIYVLNKTRSGWNVVEAVHGEISGNFTSSSRIYSVLAVSHPLPLFPISLMYTEAWRMQAPSLSWAYCWESPQTHVLCNSTWVAQPVYTGGGTSV